VEGTVREVKRRVRVVASSYRAIDRRLPWSRYPGEMHLPGMNFAGPGTRLDLR